VEDSSVVTASYSKLYCTVKWSSWFQKISIYAMCKSTNINDIKLFNHWKIKFSCGLYLSQPCNASTANSRMNWWHASPTRNWLHSCPIYILTMHWCMQLSVDHNPVISKKALDLAIQLPRICLWRGFIMLANLHSLKQPLMENVSCQWEEPFDEVAHWVSSWRFLNANI